MMLNIHYTSSIPSRWPKRARQSFKRTSPPQYVVIGASHVVVHMDVMVQDKKYVMTWLVHQLVSRYAGKMSFHSWCWTPITRGASQVDDQNVKGMPPTGQPPTTCCAFWWRHLLCWFTCLLWCKTWSASWNSLLTWMYQDIAENVIRLMMLNTHYTSSTSS